VDVVIISPEPGQHKEIGQRLMAIIEAMGLPRTTLQWVTHPVAGYLVPLEVEHELHAEALASEEEADAPTPKKRGRAKKTPVQDTDKGKEE